MLGVPLLLLDFQNFFSNQSILNVKALGLESAAAQKTSCLFSRTYFADLNNYLENVFLGKTVVVMREL